MKCILFCVAGSTPNNDISESLSRLHVDGAQKRPSMHDIQNQAIKTLFKTPSGGVGGDVQVVTVKEAWAPQKSTPDEVVMRGGGRDKNLNAINNNNGSGGSSVTAVEELKRRSFHPQDYLSRVLDVERHHSAKNRRKQDFPKVQRDTYFRLIFLLMSENSKAKKLNNSRETQGFSIKLKDF